MTLKFFEGFLSLHVLGFLVLIVLHFVNMAATSTQQYNLRSGRQENIQLPVQLQLGDGSKLDSKTASVRF